MKILFRPIAAWPHRPTPVGARRTWPNARGLSVGRALDLVDHELQAIGCRRDAYIEVDVDDRHIRLDGELRANTVPRSPACIIYADHPRLGTLRWACDQYTRLEYNIRAIAGTLSSLRAVDRYGCVRDNEQFRGFKALPATASQTVSLDAALTILAKYGPRLDAQTSSKDAFARAVRAAQAATHPDRHGGERLLWDEVERALVVLAPVRWREA